MANDKNFKIKNGLLAGRYLGSNGTLTSGSEGYSLAGASYDSVSLSSTEEANPISIVFKPDGTKVYFAGGTKDVHQFDFTTAWDLSTASFASKSKDVGAPEGGTAYNPIDLIFSSDGTKLWVFSNRASSTEVYQWNLSTAWDISTASYASIKKDLTGVSDTGAAIQFNSDGTVLVVGHTNGTLAHWDLSTAYNVSTATEATSKRTSLSGVSNLRSIHFKSNGTSLFILHGGSDREVREFSLSTAYDITTASLESDTFNYGSQETSANDLEFKPDGNKMYIIGSNGDAIYQYSTVLTTQTLDLSTGHYFNCGTLTGSTELLLSNPPASGKAYAAQIEVTGGGVGYDFSNASYDNKSLDTSSQQNNPLAIQLSEDGTKFYVAGSTGDEMHQYTLTTPYDITTATYENVSFDHSSENGTIQGIRFANDPTDTTTYGKRMYLLGTATSKVVSQYTLSTAWDISTATFDSPTFSIATQVTGTARSLSFSADGSSFFVLDETPDVLYQYDMTTPWDLSTASYASKSLDVTAEESIPQGHSFNADGTELFVIGESGGDVNKYTLTTGFDISTASFDSVVFTPGSEFTQANVRDAVFGSDGTKFYLVENVGSTVLQYSSATSFTLTWPDSIKWDSGAAAPSPDVGSKDIYSLITIDGGTTYYGKGTGENMS